MYKKLVVVLMMCSTLYASLDCSQPCQTYQSYLKTIGASVGVANLGTKPTPTQVSAMTGTYINYLMVANSSGVIAQAQMAIQKNATTIEASSPNISVLYQGMKSAGWKGTQAQVQTFIDETTQATRFAIVAAAKSGLYQHLLSQAGVLLQNVSVMQLTYKPKLLNASYKLRRIQIDCNAWQQMDDEELLVAGIATLIGLPELGGAIGLFVAGSALARDFYC